MQLKSNLDVRLLEGCAKTAKEIRGWLENKDHPEQYKNVTDLEVIRNFIHTLDLLETVLVRFEISAHFALVALNQMEQSLAENSYPFDFIQIDVEEYFASNLLELCNQLSQACKKLKKFADDEKTFLILKKYPETLTEILIARHTASHFVPEQFENHKISRHYSILRRPYREVDGVLIKEFGRFTMPRVKELIKDSVMESYHYLILWREATIG